MDCPRIAPAIDTTKDLPYEERFIEIRNDVESLYKYCLKKDFSTQQIKDCLTPFLGGKQSIYKRILSGSWRPFLWISIFVAMVAIVIEWNISFWFVHAQLRSAQLKILPYWDWSKIYDRDCVFDNPYIVSENFTVKDCKGCLEFQLDMKPGEIDRLHNVNTTLLTDNYLTADWPVVITDPARDWPVENGNLKLSLDAVEKLYVTHESLVEGMGLESCEFHSTMEDVRTLYEFLKRSENQTLPEMYHVAWDNCEVKAAKVFRLYTKRPYFLPAMVELSRSNQLVIANGNFSGHIFSLPQQADSAVWMVLLKGVMNITLIATQECKHIGCVKQPHFILNAGQAVLVPTRVWSMEYSPINNDITFAFASSVIWDNVKL